MAKYCPNCGSPVAEDNTFCAGCGNRLKLETTGAISAAELAKIEAPGSGGFPFGLGFIVIGIILIFGLGQVVGGAVFITLGIVSLILKL